MNKLMQRSQAANGNNTRSVVEMRLLNSWQYCKEKFDDGHPGVERAYKLLNKYLTKSNTDTEVLPRLVVSTSNIILAVKLIDIKFSFCGAAIGAGISWMSELCHSPISLWYVSPSLTVVWYWRVHLASFNSILLLLASLVSSCCFLFLALLSSCIPRRQVTFPGDRQFSLLA